MAELVSGAIRVFMWKDLEGSIQMSKIDPKEMLKNFFNEFKAIHVDDNNIVHFFYLNGRVLEIRSRRNLRWRMRHTSNASNFQISS